MIFRLSTSPACVVEKGETFHPVARLSGYGVCVLYAQSNRHRPLRRFRSALARALAHVASAHRISMRVTSGPSSSRPGGLRPRDHHMRPMPEVGRIFVSQGFSSEFPILSIAVAALANRVKVWSSQYTISTRSIRAIKRRSALCPFPFPSPPEGCTQRA